MGLGGSIPNFPFKIDSAKPEYIHNTATLSWTIRQGTRVEDAMPVSIFTISISKEKVCQDPKDTNRRLLARNALKYSKSLMLPGVLRCYGGVEYDNCIYIATERCDPLSCLMTNMDSPHESYSDLKGQRYEQEVALGLKHVGEALIDLGRNGLMHGNMCGETVYVTEKGFWRLWGLELVSTSGNKVESSNHDASLYNKLAADFLPTYRISDRIGRQNSSVDMWCMACLIFEAFRSRSSANADTASLSPKSVHSCKQQLPDSLQVSFVRLLSDKGDALSAISRFLENCDFINESTYVQCLSDIDQYILMDTTQRETLMDRLSSAVSEFPLRVCLMAIIPKLMELIQMDTPPVNIVNPIIEISKLVVDDAAFEAHIAPNLALLFQSTNVAIQYSLLESMDVYGSRLSRTMLEKIWPLFAKGIISTSARIRDGSVRALVHIAGQLSPRILTQEVPFLVQKVQSDSDGVIRTNATIALSMIAQHMPPEVRQKVLVSTSVRMLKDSFVPSRIAALQAIGTVLAELKSRELSEVVIPRVVPLITDPVGNVRELSILILKNSLEKFEADHYLCLELERAHQLEDNRQEDAVSNKTQRSYSINEGTTTYESRAEWLQESSSGAKPPLSKPSHSHSPSFPSHSESNTSFLGPAQTFSQGLQQSYSDAYDGWEDDVGSLKLSKGNHDAKDTDSDGWGEVVRIPVNTNIPSSAVPPLMEASQNTGQTFDKSSLISMMSLRGNKMDTSLGSTTVLTQNNTSLSGSIKNEKPVNVMKLRSKKKSLGVVRLD
ncbi:unnamed protein product [Phytomonas sp. Hart1]|nr:unnamed protein product [Phytomonas sp. Hart1]|eukprot:CCW70308.1 unnamed protein product [Phytomonas sp. isolate Hart1]